MPGEALTGLAPKLLTQAASIADSYGVRFLDGEYKHFRRHQAT